MDTVEMKDPARELEDRLQFIGLDAAARQALRAIKPIVDREIPLALDKFYARALAHPAVRGFFADAALLERAKKAQVEHWKRLSAGEFEGRWFESARRIGETHARIGLSPKWYAAGYGAIAEHLIAATIAEIWPKGALRGGAFAKGADAGAALSALMRVVLLDFELASSAYLDALEARRARLRTERRAKRARDPCGGRGGARGGRRARRQETRPSHRRRPRRRLCADGDRLQRRRRRPARRDVVVRGLDRIAVERDAADRQRGAGPVLAHRARGLQHRAKLGGARRGRRAGRQDGGGRAIGAGDRHRRRRRGAAEQRGRRPGDQRHGPDREIVQRHRQDHRRHRRDRVPDQPAGAQRRRRGGAGGRRRARLRRRCRGSARPGAELGGRGEGDQDAGRRPRRRRWRAACNSSAPPARRSPRSAPRSAR